MRLHRVRPAVSLQLGIVAVYAGCRQLPARRR